MKKIYEDINLFIDRAITNIIKNNSIFFRIFLLEILLIVLSIYYTKSHPFISMGFSIIVLIYSLIFLYKKNKLKI